MSAYEQSLYDSCKRIKVRKPDNYTGCVSWILHNLKADESSPSGLADPLGNPVGVELQPTKNNQPQDRWQVQCKNDFTGRTIGLMASHVAFYIRRGRFQFNDEV